MPNAFHAIHRVPVDGEYVVRVVLGGLRPKTSMPVTIALWVDEKQLQTTTHDQEQAASFSDDRQDFGGQAVQFRVRLAAGDHWLSVAIPRIYEGLPARYNGPNPSTRPDTPREFRPPANAPPERLALLKKRFEEAGAELVKIPLNGVRVNAVEVGGPYEYVKGPSKASVQKIYTCGHLTGAHQPTCAPRIVTSFARRAFRRPVTAREMEKYVALVRRAQKEEGSFDEGLAVGLQAILVSPDFLFRIERDRPAAGKAATVRISPHELATRLSYFLWASMPDETLRRAADTGTLRDPKVLAYQVRRMLRDPKSRALAENFGGQWLQFRALESLTRDREKFPDFEDYLRLSMRHETELFVDHVVRTDRSVLDFIDGRYSFLNERLAKHYKVPGVTGPEFRRVDLTGTNRGGVLTQGSVLAVSSVRDADVPRAARQVGARQPAQRASTRAPGRRTEPRRDDDRHVGVDARAARAAPEGIRRAPRATGGWIRSASAWRTSTRSAHGARPTESSRSTRKASSPTDGRSTAPTSCGRFSARSARRSRGPSRRSSSRTPSDAVSSGTTRRP